MTVSSRSPAELRSMFGENLRKLATGRGSISGLARDLGINRTQFNRYLSGESFPRPDVLGRICAHFGVDARVLLDPIENLESASGGVSNRYISNFLGEDVTVIPEETLPTGFYHFSRRSFVDASSYVRGVVYVHRVGDNTFLKGYEPRDAMALQGIPPELSAREFRGMALKMDDGIAVTASRKNGVTASFTYMNRVASFQNNFWVGYVARTVPENPTSGRVTRLVYEYLGRGLGPALRFARRAGFCDADDLLPFHQRLLQPDVPFR